MSKKIDKVKEKFGIVKASAMKKAEYVRTGFIRIDDARKEAGKLGLKRGSITVLYGQTGAGKSSGCYQIISNMQKNDLTLRTLVIDVEASFDKDYAEVRGMDLDRVDVMPLQEWLDEALEGIQQVIAASEYDLVIIDSIHGQAVARDDKKLTKEKSVAALSGKLTQFVQVTKHAVHSTNTMLLIIGQARDNMDKYGDPIHLTGGNQLKHDADLILQVTRSTSATRCEGVIPTKKNDAGKLELQGHMALFKVEKARGRGMGTRFAMPFLIDEGFSESRCLIEEAANADWGKELFSTTSHFFKWEDVNGEEQKLTGKSKLLEYFSTNAVELGRLQEAVKDKLTDTPEVTSEDENEPLETLQADDSK